MNEQTTSFKTAEHKAELKTADHTLRVQRGANGKRYRADVTGAHRAFFVSNARGPERDRMKRIIDDASEADAWFLLRDLTTGR